MSFLGEKLVHFIQRRRKKHFEEVLPVFGDDVFGVL
jgi:hypothetical protein